MRTIPAQAIQSSSRPLEVGVTAFEHGDFATALEYLRPFAERGDTITQTVLGGLYHYGRGVPQDDAKAAKWLRKAAEQGNARGQTLLGLLFAMGRGVPKDDVSAYMWLHIAAASNITEARNGRDKVARGMTTVETMKAQRMANKWMAKHQKRQLDTSKNLANLTAF